MSDSKYYAERSELLKRNGVATVKGKPMATKEEIAEREKAELAERVARAKKYDKSKFTATPTFRLSTVAEAVKKTSNGK